MPVSSRPYRADIDGLRMLAVGAVIAYHLGAHWAPGGFVGVDIFFVISGYLITRIIVTELEEGRFSLARFYLRRVRRIFPALIFTIIVVGITGYFLFSPALLQRLGMSIVTAVLSVSNFFFLSEAGYFDVQAGVKPLLHTWSLGVEEQFYLFWPLLLVGLVRLPARWTFAGLAAVGVLSLIASQIAVIWWPEAAFYMVPFRVFEFAIGGLLIWVQRRFEPRGWLADGLSVLGFAALIFSVLRFRESMDFPGVSALLPSIGAGILIWTSASRLNQWLLGNPVMVAGGKISYSLYLVHWPIIVFYIYFNVARPGSIEQAIMLVAMFVLATLMYRFIETPFRRAQFGNYRLATRPFLIGCFTLSVMVIAPAAFGWQSSGMVWRMPEAVQKSLGNLQGERNRSWSLVNGEDAVGVQAFQPGGLHILITGDSHSKSMFNALYLNRDRFPGLQFRRAGLSDQCFYVLEQGESFAPSNADEQRCWEEYRGLMDSKALPGADIVLVATQWNSAALEYVPLLKQMLEERGIRLALVTRSAQFSDIPELLSRYRSFDALQGAADTTVQDFEENINGPMRSLADRLDLPVLDVQPMQCFGQPRSCPVVRNNQLLYYDGHHWTMRGARFFGRRMARQGFLDPLLESDSL